MMRVSLTLILAALLSTACGQSKERMEGYDLIEKVYEEGEALPLEVKRSDEEWKEMLTEEQYQILRQAATEQAFTGKYYKNKDVGTYYSAASGQPLFLSDAKYDSGCGWPSFFAPIEPDAIIYRMDRTHGMQRIEILDSKSGSHLGHVFNDGPPPRGLRYCLNSEAMIFVPQGGNPADCGVPGWGE